MPAGYHHLTHCERCQIHALLHRGFSKREIARELGRDPGTISRELSRNRGQRGYRHKQAHGKAMPRRREASRVPRKMTPGRLEVVEGKLISRMESGVDRGPVSAPGRSDGRQGMDLSACACGPGGRHPVPAPAPPWQEAELACGRHAGRGHIPGRCGHCGASFGGGGEEPDRGLGSWKFLVFVSE